jgi:hypothetical protein
MTGLQVLIIVGGLWWLLRSKPKPKRRASFKGRKR